LAPSGTPLFRLDNLTLRVAVRGERAPRTVFESASLTVAAGESVAVLGAPGTGKTLLARAAALIDRPARGRVLLGEQDITRAWGGRMRALRRDLQYVGGDPRRSLSPRLNAQSILAEPLQVHGLGTAAERRDRIAETFTVWDLNPYLLFLRPDSFSTTVCLRIALARAHILQPRLVVCDGLTERLEPGANRALLAGIAGAYRAAGTAWLWTTSDLDLAAEFADKTYVIENGALRLVYGGAGDDRRQTTDDS
jgi:ABC-type glutathione transport system ATPase component